MGLIVKKYLVDYWSDMQNVPENKAVWQLLAVSLKKLGLDVMTYSHISDDPDMVDPDIYFFSAHGVSALPNQP